MPLSCFPLLSYEAHWYLLRPLRFELSIQQGWREADVFSCFKPIVGATSRLRQYRDQEVPPTVVDTSWKRAGKDAVRQLVSPPLAGGDKGEGEGFMVLSDSLAGGILCWTSESLSRVGWIVNLPVLQLDDPVSHFGQG
jgi:hypothetical protein